VSELTLSKDDISALLFEFADELEVQGSHGDLFLVGGAAMALKVMAARSASEALDDVQLHYPHQTIPPGEASSYGMIRTDGRCSMATAGVRRRSQHGISSACSLQGLPIGVRAP
jgi:hypothetical protein